MRPAFVNNVTSGSRLREGRLCIGVCQLCMTTICWGNAETIPWRQDSAAVVCKRCKDEYHKHQVQILRNQLRSKLEAELATFTNVVVKKGNTDD